MLVYGALVPHPPLIVPKIGGDQLTGGQATVKGMQQIAVAVKQAEPETLVFLTPHGNVFADALSVLTTDIMKGDLGSFGHPDLKSSHPPDMELVEGLLHRAKEVGVYMLGIDEALAWQHELSWELDHGILVPLYYLEQAGLRDIPVVAVSTGFISRERLYAFGKIIADAARNLNRRIAIIASGDMSHRLLDDGPYSYHPDGPTFDQDIRNLIEKRDVQGILELPEVLVQNAGECGYRSLVILLGALEGRDFDSRVYSYEGPFGVGYLTAGFTPGGARQERKLQPYLQKISQRKMESTREKESLPVSWARRSLEHYIKTGGDKLELPDDVMAELNRASGTFVTLKKDGRLRGCIGTIFPTRENLGLEIRANAISAGTRDYRFTPVTEEELEELVYSVDVLTEPEPVKSIRELDAQRYGIIVRSGPRVGVLLPDLEGVDTVEEQVRIALQKAEIQPDEPYRIERFEVKRYT